MYPNSTPTYAHSNVNAPDYAATPPLPESNTGWAAAALIFFWPLAFAAFNHSSRVYPLWAVGDHAGARHASAQAKRLGKIALLIWAVLTVLIVLFYVVVVAVAVSAASTY
ncbi:hypothetical protein ABIC28_001618 [Rhodococcus sp. PvR044]|uniref:CD225/dispanin family protein n=1 Tax=Rhodococcus sp. PvR044 TaxID=3156402 RepID=UPI0033918616